MWALLQAMRTNATLLRWSVVSPCPWDSKLIWLAPQFAVVPIISLHFYGLLFFFFFFLWPCCTACGILFPSPPRPPGNPHPLQWKHGILTTGPSGKSRAYVLEASSGLAFCICKCFLFFVHLDAKFSASASLLPQIHSHQAFPEFVTWLNIWGLQSPNFTSSPTFLSDLTFFSFLPS